MSTSRLNEMMAESGLSGHDADELASVLSPLAVLSGEAAPTPSAELMQLFAGPAPEVTPSIVEQPSSRSLRRKHRAHGAVAGVVVLALSGVGATGLSAAANTLPARWQHGVADFSHHYLPFDFPEPAERQRLPLSQGLDSGRAVRGGERTLGGSRGETTDTSRSASRDEAEARGGPAWQGRDPRASGERPAVQTAQSSGYSLPQGPGWQHQALAPAGIQSAPEERPSEAEPGTEDGRDRSRSGGDRPTQSPSERPGGGEPAKNGSKGDPDRGDRPVRGGGIGGPKDTQKKPQNGPLPSKPGGGADPGAPGQDEPKQTPSDREPVDGGPSDDRGPADKEVPSDPLGGDPLSGLVDGAKTLLEGGTD